MPAPDGIGISPTGIASFEELLPGVASECSLSLAYTKNLAAVAEETYAKMEVGLSEDAPTEDPILSEEFGSFNSALQWVELLAPFNVHRQIVEQMQETTARLKKIEILCSQTDLKPEHVQFKKRVILVHFTNAIEKIKASCIAAPRFATVAPSAEDSDDD